MVTPTYPGVYVEEIPSGVRTITGVATSITAFIGRAKRGPVDDPVRIQGYADYARKFGGLWADSTMSYAVQHYFLNGGADAIIVRVHKGAVKAGASLSGLTLEASSEGTWGDNLHAIADHETKDKDDQKMFNLTIQELDPVSKDVIAAEKFLNISVDAASPRFVATVLDQGSALARVQGSVPSSRPDAGSADFTGGSDGDPITDDEISKSDLAVNKQGIWALEKADLFNMLCIPPLARTEAETDDVGTATLSAALAYCKKRRAVLFVDSRFGWNEISDVTDTTDGVDSLGVRDENAAIYFPRLKMPDQLRENRLADFVPCGVVTGVIARTDATRGIWKAPAGIDATLLGVSQLTVKMTDGENGILNPLGVNCLRTLPVIGHVVWGARTLEGADVLASEWKYLSVRRVALYIEESLYRGTQWAVFEPNDEPLWSQLRLNIGAFMHSLFRQGAFQGQTPKDAYFVKCDKETTTQDDINKGIVNIIVGFAPLKPAEFVIIKLQQMAGQIQA